MDWVDTHCHLDAPEFAADRAAVLARARAAGVCLQVLPAVASGHFEALAEYARSNGLAYAIGIHPLWLEREAVGAAARVEAALQRHADDPHLVAVGEIGLDGFVAGLDPQIQEDALRAQLTLARDGGLPVILHVRRRIDRVLQALRRTRVRGGIAHAFNGSRQQAEAFLELGFKLGFGGALTFERAAQIRRLAAELPADSLVLETDAPDIPPQWLYRDARARAAGASQGRNEPGELPAIGAALADLRGWSLARTAEVTRRNAVQALPRLAGLLAGPPGADQGGHG